jgi:hypothetical protein
MALRGKAAWKAASTVADSRAERPLRSPMTGAGSLRPTANGSAAAAPTPAMNVRLLHAMRDYFP